MNWTEDQLSAHYARSGASVSATASEPRKPSTKAAAVKPTPVEGPLECRLILYGHCPSKKSMYRTTEARRLVLTDEAKEQIAVLKTQALFQWAAALGPGVAPVEHPDMTIQFFVTARRQDEDGMWITIVDILQTAGILVNDNIAHNNGRKIHEPCILTVPKDERVEILISKA